MRGIIFGNTFENSQKKFEELLNRYKLMGIDVESLIKTKNELKCCFANGDYWRAVSLASSRRGLRCHIAYIDDTIDPATIDMTIKPCLTAGPYCAYNYFHIWAEEAFQ